MPYYKITRIILYAVAGISLLVILFFYGSPATVDIDELEMRVEELANPVDLDDMTVPLPVADTAETDSSAVEETAMAEGIEEAGEVEEIAADEPEEEEEVFATADVVDTSNIKLRDHMSGWEYLVYFRTDIALVWAYILFIIAAIAAIVFPLISVLSRPKALIRLALVLGGAAVLIVISYLMASEAPIDIIGYSRHANRNPGTLKMVDTTLFITYMLFGMAILSILYSIISRVFK